jgi:hypothetical protein
LAPAEAAGTRREPRTLLLELRSLDRRLRKTAALSFRLHNTKARTDMRDWAVARRERTRHLIELGGLVQKAGLVELTDDDRATLLGAFLDLADQLRLGRDQEARTPQQLTAVWRRRGLRAFDADKAAAGATGNEAGLPGNETR